MNKFLFLTVITIFFVIHAIAVSDVCAIGVYLDLPSFFTVSDSLRTQITIAQSFLQPDEGTVSTLEGELAFRVGFRTFLRLGISYAAMHRDAAIIHDIGDGSIYMTVRVTGDTLDTSGLFIRLDGRIPFGSEEFSPFSFKSLDGGAGLEYRLGHTFLGLRLAATYNLVGKRRKSDSAFINRNFLLLAARIDFELARSSRFYFSAYTAQYREGGSRDAYIVTLDQKLSKNLGLQLNGGLEAGKEENRVFNSLFSIALVYLFPVKEKPDDEKENAVPPVREELDEGTGTAVPP